MSTGMDREALGDWSNLKGSRYHLVYALWLILRDQAGMVHFYKGNDLFATPAEPPILPETPDVPAVPLAAAIENTDLWIQLKCTRNPWTVTNILGENLLYNFILNSLCSEERGRAWRTILVTEAEVRGEALLEFVANPSQKPELSKRLGEIVAQAFHTLQANGGTGRQQAEIHARALEILGQLAATDPVSLATLKAQVETELALSCPDRRRVRRLASLLIGAMIEDAAEGPGRSRHYDAAWVNEVTGTGIKSSKPFDVDVAAACDIAISEAVTRIRSGPHRDERHAPRAALIHHLARFLASSETVFLLTGPSGTGKSSSLAHWARGALAGRTRLLVEGSELGPSKPLRRLVADYFAPYSDRDWSDQEFFGKLIGTALEPERGPLVVIADDLTAAQLDSSQGSHVIRDLVDAIRQVGGKLVISCETQAWRVYRPWLQLPEGSLYDPERTLAAPSTNRSYELDVLNPDEFADVIKRRFPGLSAAQSRQTARLLHGPGHVPLRKASLLTRYLELHGEGLLSRDAPPGPVDIGRILAEVIRRRLEEASAILLHDDVTTATAWAQLVDRLWERRSVGLSHKQAIDVLDANLPGSGNQALAAFRRVGLLTATTPIRIADASIADYVYADRFEVGLVEGNRQLSELDPEADGTVTEALVSRSTNCPDLIRSLRARDDRFSGPIARGLAQRKPDLMTSALAVSLSRPSGKSLVNHEGCLALGLLAARDRRTFRYTAEMYLSTDRLESIRGSESLSHVMRFLPGRVGRIVQFRLKLELASVPQKRTLGRRLSDAITPLHRIEHIEAAAVARRVLDDLLRSVDVSVVPDSSVLADTIDLIRGQSIPYEEDASLEQLIRELRSDDPTTRWRAAAVFRAVSQAIPERIVDPLCDAIRREQHPFVLGRLILGTYRVLELAHEELLDAVRQSRAISWREPYPTAAALALLGHAARFDKEAVLSMLPNRLEHLEPWARACLSDVLSFAWWRLAEVEPRGRAVLEALEAADLQGVSRAFRVFAERGASIAALGRLALDAASGVATTVSMTRDSTSPLPYFYTNTGDLFERHARTLASDSRIGDFLTAALRVVGAGHGIQPNPWQEQLNSAQLIAARNALNELLDIVKFRNDYIDVIKKLPRGWEAMFAARRLIEAGTRSDDLIGFAQEACDEHASGGTLDALHERELLLGQIALLREEPGTAVLARLADSPRSLMGAADSGRAQTLATYIDFHPDQVLVQVDAVLSEPDGFVALFGWHGLARNWLAILASDLFRRMFDTRTINLREAVRLVAEMQTVIRYLPDSDANQEHEEVYAAIDSWLKLRPAEVGTRAASDSPLHHANTVVSKLLHQANDAIGRGEGGEWLGAFLSDRKNWLQTESYSLSDGSISRTIGGATRLMYMLPALRLSLVAVGNAFRLADPAGLFAAARRSVESRLSSAYTSLHYERNPERLIRVARNLEGADPPGVRDERVLSTSGHLYLLAGQLDDAEDRLRRAAASSMMSEGERGSALYNLACVLARSGRKEECREMLNAALLKEPKLLETLSSDEDLSSVREEDWFLTMVRNAPARPEATGPLPPESTPDAPSFDSPLVAAIPEGMPQSFEGWTIRHAVLAAYDDQLPAWGRLVRPALSIQFAGATVEIERVPEVDQELILLAPEDTDLATIEAVRHVAELVLESLARRSVGDRR